MDQQIPNSIEYPFDYMEDGLIIPIRTVSILIPTYYYKYMVPINPTYLQYDMAAHYAQPPCAFMDNPPGGITNIVLSPSMFDPLYQLKCARKWLV